MEPTAASGPSMSPERWQRMKDILASALAREPAERMGYVAEACAADHKLKAEVESLLVAHDGASGFLDAPPEAAHRSPRRALEPGACLGP
ncbi:MAG TPA: hypothetical protein VIK51_05205, partial [Vicinamibacteria bacterium]